MMSKLQHSTVQYCTQPQCLRRTATLPGYVGSQSSTSSSIPSLKRLLDSFAPVRITRRQFFASLVVIRMNGGNMSHFLGAVTDSDDILVTTFIVVRLAWFVASGKGLHQLHIKLPTRTSRFL
jgi:hypothetical protein